jgi:hypothetical protein
LPKIQLIRRDSTIIELEATSIGISIQRNVLVHPIPLLATRAALDLNQPQVGIVIDGIITDDEEAKGASAAELTLDLSLAFGNAGATSWYLSALPNGFALGGGLGANWPNIKTQIHLATIKFQTKGQVVAGLGEANEIRLYNGSLANTVATKSVINVNVSSTTNTSTLSTAIVNALNAASIKVDTATVSLSSHVTVSTKAGQAAAVSYQNQNGSIGTYSNEMISIRNVQTGELGNTITNVMKQSGTSNTSWEKQFFVTNMTGGVDGIQMTRGDKLQDLINAVTNPSAGGALISPQVLTGSAIDLPDSIASFDSAQFLRIDQAKSVKKYIVGVRIPYESLVSSASGNRELRQFLIPAGPGTDHSAISNTESYDPVDIINNKAVRPNPFLRQGVAIPVVVQSFDPGYEAGDSVWTYQINLAPVEQLVGL